MNGRWIVHPKSIYVLESVGKLLSKVKSLQSGIIYDMYWVPVFSVIRGRGANAIKMFLFMSHQNKYSNLYEQHHKETPLYVQDFFFPYQVRAQIHFDVWAEQSNIQASVHCFDKSWFTWTTDDSFKPFLKPFFLSFRLAAFITFLSSVCWVCYHLSTG